MNQKQELLKQLFPTLFKLRRIIDQSFTSSGEGITFLQIQVLEYLDANPKSTVGQLAQEFRMSSPAIAQLIDRLESAKLIIREADINDRRVIRLSPSKIGVGELQTVPATVQKKMSDIFFQISDRDLEELVRIFTNLFKNLENANK